LYQKKNLPFGFFWIYIPRGPLCFAEDFSKVFDEILRQEKKAIYFQVELPTSENFFETSDKVFINNVKEINPQNTLKINLNQSEDEILKNMKPKGRYNIKVAKKKCIKIVNEKNPSDKNLDDFYNILLSTKNRKGIGIHPKKVYEQIFKNTDSCLFLAKHENDILSGAILIFYGDIAIYYYGASSDKKRNFMSPYLLQWEMIKFAKNRGCKFYDFLGVCPKDNKNHHLFRVSSFKRKFGGEDFYYFPSKIFIQKKFLFFCLKIFRWVRGFF